MAELERVIKDRAEKRVALKKLIASLWIILFIIFCIFIKNGGIKQGYIFLYHKTDAGKARLAEEKRISESRGYHESIPDSIIMGDSTKFQEWMNGYAKRVERYYYHSSY